MREWGAAVLGALVSIAVVAGSVWMTGALAITAEAEALKKIVMILLGGWAAATLLIWVAIYWVQGESQQTIQQLYDRINLLGSDLEDARNHVKMLEGRLRIKDEEERREAKQMQSTATMDSLTGLYNEAYFHEIFPREINRAKRDKKQLVLTLIEIGNLPDYAKVNGEEAVRKLIAGAAMQIKQCAKRAGDFSFHFDDDHFGVLFSGLSLDNTKRFVEFIHDHLQDMAQTLGTDSEVPVSFTLASVLGFGDSMPEGEAYYNTAREFLISSVLSSQKITYREL